MTLLNVSFGIYAFLPQGWIFMVIIILIECFGLSYLLTKKWKNRKIFPTVFVSNIVSGVLGIITTLIINGGWWLVVWFPWVSDSEVRGEDSLRGLIFLYLIAFLLTLLIEGFINLHMLKKEYAKAQILKKTFVVNVFSYAIGSIAMYTYTF
jgi:hypothetical protein